MSIWTKLTSWWEGQTIEEVLREPVPSVPPTPETRVEVEMPPVKPIEEPSCFVKGIIRSIEDNVKDWYEKRAGTWVDDNVNTLNWPFRRICHYSSDMIIDFHRTRPSKYQRGIIARIDNGPSITAHESRLILSAFDEAEKKRGETTRLRKQAAIRAIFEPLGCPPSAPDQS